MSSCHARPEIEVSGGGVALVGQPNVGKSVLFQRLTGRYVTVANYPGTTVEVARGGAQFMPATVVIDTPGIVAFPPRGEDEQVAARVLLHESLRAIVQVGDAKSLRRTLLLSVQLAEMGVPMVLALNMTDEADAPGSRSTIACSPSFSTSRSWPRSPRAGAASRRSQPRSAARGGRASR